MFFSNILKNIFGFIREIILAYIFGSSLIFAFYILLKTAVDFLSQFTFGNALEANLLPKLSSHFIKYRNVSYNNLFVFTRKVSIYIFVISLIIQICIILQLKSSYTYILLLVSIILSFLMSMNFFNSVFLTVLKSEGKFKKYSISTAISLFYSIVFLYPLAIIINVLGVAVSRLIGVLFLTMRYVQPILKRKISNEINISRKDFSISVLLLANLPSMILLLSRFISGTDGDNNIAYFNYAIVFLNVVFTAIILNINSLMLRKMSISKNLNWFFYSVLFGFLCGISIFLFAQNYSILFIELIYFRGAFTYDDIFKTAVYFKNMSGAIVILILSSIISQPYFTLDFSIRKKFSKNILFGILFSFIIILLILFLNDWTAFKRSLIILYFMSFINLIFSVYSFIKYYNNEG